MHTNSLRDSRCQLPDDALIGVEKFRLLVSAPRASATTIFAFYGRMATGHVTVFPESVVM